MKIYFVQLLAFATASLVFACNKKESIETESLKGTWKLTATYDDFGGAIRGWRKVPSEELHLVEFAVNGQYIQTDSTAAAVKQCLGTYKATPATNITINSTCETEPVVLAVADLSNEALITERLGTEGIIRSKYVAYK